VQKTGRNFKLFMSNILGSGKKEKVPSLLPLSTHNLQPKIMVVVGLIAKKVFDC
jgi:hypothetical protein